MRKEHALCSPGRASSPKPTMLFSMGVRHRRRNGGLSHRTLCERSRRPHAFQNDERRRRHGIHAVYELVGEQRKTQTVFCGSGHDTRASVRPVQVVPVGTHLFGRSYLHPYLSARSREEHRRQKWTRPVIYAVTIAFTGIVAISRIAAGAHYMSDVLFGGTLSFLCMMIGREIFIFKGAHFKALFERKAVPLDGDNAETAE